MNQEDQSHHEEIEDYGDPGIVSMNAKVPKFLILTYCILPIWGIATLFYFWNGSVPGIMDPGYWHQLQIAANTTLPQENQNVTPEEKPIIPSEK